MTSLIESVLTACSPRRTRHRSVMEICEKKMSWWITVYSYFLTKFWKPLQIMKNSHNLLIWFIQNFPTHTSIIRFYQIYLQVLPISVDIVAETRDSSENDCQALVGASPVVIIEQSYRNPQPLFICLPCERPNLNALKNRLSGAPCPQDSGIVTMSRLSKCAMHDFVGMELFQY